jgi:hypothetical protein
MHYIARALGSEFDGPRFDPGESRTMMMDRHDGRDVEAPPMPEPMLPREPPQVGDPAPWGEAVVQT